MGLDPAPVEPCGGLNRGASDGRRGGVWPPSRRGRPPIHQLQCCINHPCGGTLDVSGWPRVWPPLEKR